MANRAGSNLWDHRRDQLAGTGRPDDPPWGHRADAALQGARALQALRTRTLPEHKYIYDWFRFTSTLTSTSRGDENTNRNFEQVVVGAFDLDGSLLATRVHNLVGGRATVLRELCGWWVNADLGHFERSGDLVIGV